MHRITRVRLSSAPSFDHSSSPASFPGRSSLQRVSLEQLVLPSSAGPPLQGTKLAAPSTPEAIRETDSISRLLRSGETTAECISLGPEYSRKRPSHSVRCSSAAFQKGFSYISEPRAGSSIRIRGPTSGSATFLGGRD